MTTMYGIKNCDTIKKARKWLEDRGVAYDFHDYKASGIDAARLNKWSDALGWPGPLSARYPMPKSRAWIRTRRSR
jgi:arsenate reductase-like glutaredoxin family protein